ncbi:MAG TPA: hypothetical protein VFX92_07570 [Candidatus Krumholzibacteria bacterium]|nr:hypothetical protein [Candidatus Krumholzibacteria bacterium]
MRFLAMVTTLSFATACTHAVKLPPEDIAQAAGRDAKRAWQIDTRSGDRYLAKRYSLTDSTLVIEQLAGLDEFYGERKTADSLTIARTSIASISRVAAGPGTAILIGAALFTGLVAFVLMNPPGTTVD